MRFGPAGASKAPSSQLQSEAVRSAASRIRTSGQEFPQCGCWTNGQRAIDRCTSRSRQKWLALGRIWPELFPLSRQSRDWRSSHFMSFALFQCHRGATLPATCLLVAHDTLVYSSKAAKKTITTVAFFRYSLLLFSHSESCGKSASYIMKKSLGRLKMPRCCLSFDRRKVGMTGTERLHVSLACAKRCEHNVGGRQSRFGSWDRLSSNTIVGHHRSITPKFASSDNLRWYLSCLIKLAGYLIPKLTSTKTFFPLAEGCMRFGQLACKASLPWHFALRTHARRNSTKRWSSLVAGVVNLLLSRFGRKCCGFWGESSGAARPGGSIEVIDHVGLLDQPCQLLISDDQRMQSFSNFVCLLCIRRSLNAGHLACVLASIR